MLIALRDVSTSDFEKFGQTFYAAMIGTKFIPLGGMHDGGAEGFSEPELYQASKPSHFLQVSKQATFETKIRKTVNRLREYGRSPALLNYVTSQIVTDIDIVEDALSEELDCRIRIRDARHIEANINGSEKTVAAFESYLRPCISHLLNPGSSPIGESTATYMDKTLAVFMRQEADHRQGNTALLESVADSLIIWSLSETDPDREVLMKRDEMLEKIEQNLPSSKQFIRGVLDHRLNALRSKSLAADRQIRYYRTKDAYCLPFETREVLREENINDNALKNAVSSVFDRRIRAIANENEYAMAPTVIDICHKAIERVFERQGLEVAQFVENQEGDEVYESVSEILSSILDHNDFDESRSEIHRIALIVLRGTFYDTTLEERSYLQKLSQTYVLMLLLRNVPQVVEFFKAMSGKFNLYIGTDFLVRALSEHYVASENQTTVNLFKVLKAAGAKLILTEKAVEELATHLRRQIFEFNNVYKYTQSKITSETVQYIDRILIRAYFYARLAPVDERRPQDWTAYIEQFASYENLRNERANDELARYLINKFKFDYQTVDEMRKDIAVGEISDLASKILEVRNASGRPKHDKVDILANNDALQILRVYQDRLDLREASPSNQFGFRTWWLTKDAGIRKATVSLVDEHHGQRFMMRPEFLLNFILFAPSTREVVESHRTIFPSVLGVRLANRLHADTFRAVMQSANEIWQVDEARAASIITQKVNELKGDLLKSYDQTGMSPIGPIEDIY